MRAGFILYMSGSDSPDETFFPRGNCQRRAYHSAKILSSPNFVRSMPDKSSGIVLGRYQSSSAYRICPAERQSIFRQGESFSAGCSLILSKKVRHLPGRKVGVSVLDWDPPVCPCSLNDPHSRWKSRARPHHSSCPQLIQTLRPAFEGGHEG